MIYDGMGEDTKRRGREWKRRIDIVSELFRVRVISDQGTRKMIISIMYLRVILRVKK